MKTCMVIHTEWGLAAVVWSGVGLWEFGWPKPDREAALAEVCLKDAVVTEAEDAWTEELKRELNIYFKGFPLEFSVPVDWGGYTDFQRRVLQHTANIPYGTVESYGQVAAAVGSPKASRAAGQALHINRTPIIVPCHRVLGANGALTGFGGGLEIKQALLLLEREGRGA